MKTKPLLLVFFLLSTLHIQNITAHTGTVTIGPWTELGSATVHHAANNAGFDVKAPADNFKKLKITARNTSFSITKVTIIFDKGEAQEINVRFDIPKNGESPLIDIDGGARNIKHVDFTVDSKDFVKGNAEVTFFVRK